MASKRSKAPPPKQRKDRFVGTGDELAFPGDPDFPRPKWLDEPKAPAKNKKR